MWPIYVLEFVLWWLFICLAYWWVVSGWVVCVVEMGRRYYIWCKCFLLSCTRPHASCVYVQSVVEKPYGSVFMLGWVVYNLYITTQLIICGHPPNIINNNTKFKGQLEVQSITTSRYMCIYINTVYLKVKNSN